MWQSKADAAKTKTWSDPLLKENLVFNMASQIKIKYFPLIELSIFLVILSILILIYVLADFNFWWVPIITIILYFHFLGGASVISLDSNRLKVMPLNFLLNSIEINTKCITKINSYSNFDPELDITAENFYFQLRRYYVLEFIDLKGRKEKIRFSISSVSMEKKILELLTSK